jgi:hypothetical protein
MSISAEEIIGSSGGDPRALHEQLAAGQQDRTVTLARAFEEAGQTARESYERGRGGGGGGGGGGWGEGGGWGSWSGWGRREHGVLAASYTNNGAAVFDAAAASNQGWKLLGQGGRDMDDTAAMLKRAVSALDQAQSTSSAALTRMSAQLDGVVRSWAAYLQANQGQYLPADRERAIASGVAVVGATRAEIQRAIDAYDRGLLRDAAELAHRGFVPMDIGGGAPDPALQEFLKQLWGARGEGLGALGGAAGLAAVLLSAKNGVKLVTKSKALLNFLRFATEPITDIAAFTRNMNAADAAILEFMRGKPNGGVLRFAMGTRAATTLGKAFLPLTVATGLMDAVTGGGYDGARGWATRGFGLAGAGGAGALLAAGALGLGPVGLGIAGAAVIGYGAWSLGNFVYDHRAEIGHAISSSVDWAGDRLSDAKDWAGARLSDAGTALDKGLDKAGDIAENVGKKALSTVSFGLF